MPLSDFLSAAQSAALRATFERIIPADEFPDAWQSGGGDYLARQFERDLADAVPLYRAGLDALDAEAQARHCADFAMLDPGAQDALLTDLERNDLQISWPINARGFVEMLVTHAAESYYGDPGNGGNRERASWQMMGFLDR